MGKRKVGEIKQRVIDLLGVPITPNTPIFLGDTNTEHMKDEHPEDFEKHFDKLEEILAKPDYVAKHPRKESIEYVKIYGDPQEHIMVAVRVSKQGTVYARTLFVMTNDKIRVYKEKGALKPY